jgi:hypothetical protein
MQNLPGKLIIFFFILVLSASCKKGDTGPAGAAGPAGATGATGAAGPQGVAGNANVITYTYASQTFTGLLNLTLTNISQGRVDSSLVLVYFNPSDQAATAWYPCPGLGSNGAYDTRYLIYQTGTSPSTYTVALRTMTLAGAAYTTAVTFAKVRVILASSSSILTGGRSSQPAVDLSDYNAVKKYYNIAD